VGAPVPAAGIDVPVGVLIGAEVVGVELAGVVVDGVVIDDAVVDGAVVDGAVVVVEDAVVVGAVVVEVVEDAAETDVGVCVDDVVEDPESPPIAVAVPGPAPMSIAATARVVARPESTANAPRRRTTRDRLRNFPLR
jgi:hypothetical protein